MSWGNYPNYGNNKQNNNKQNSYNSAWTGKTYGTTSYQSSSSNIKNGIELKEVPNDPINDISINNHNFIAAATWSGVKIWKNSPQQTQTTTTYATQTTVNPYNFEIIGESDISMKSHPEPITRCTFDTLQNSIVYFGNVFGQIFKVYLDRINDEQYAGNHTDMITGLKFCRDKCLVASSSPDGICYLWDHRVMPIDCGKFETNINCTNLDFVQNTVGICGIDKQTSRPVVKLWDVRYLMRPLITANPPKYGGYSYTSMQQSAQKGTQQSAAGTNPFANAMQSTTNQYTAKPGQTGTNQYTAKQPQTTYTVKKGVSEKVGAGYPPTAGTATTATTTMATAAASTKTAPPAPLPAATPADQERDLNLLQFSSIVLDRTGEYFAAGTYGGILIASKPKPQAAPAATAFQAAASQNKTAATNNDKHDYIFLNQKTKSLHNGINCLAMIQAPIRTKEITAYGIFAGLSSGNIVSISGFRTATGATNKEISKRINVLSNNYNKINKEDAPITACAVSPNGKLIAFANSYDYHMGPNYDLKDIKYRITVKEINIKDEFEKSL